MVSYKSELSDSSTFKTLEKRQYLPHYWSDKGCNGSVLYRMIR